MSGHHEDRHPVEAARKAVAIASHEIRGSLAAIVAHAELVVDGELDVQRREEVTRLIARNGRSLLSLLDDVLFASRIDAGAEQPHPAACSIREMLEDLVGLHAAEADRRGLYLELQVDGAVPDRFRTDAVHLRRVLENLANNAIKFTEQGGVRIRADIDPFDDLVITFEDTGVGMSEVELRTVFQPFARSIDRGRELPGCGLGLAITRELVSLLGGRIEASSEPGRGSTFVISLPALHDGDPTASHSLAGFRVLCADDCADSRLVIEHHLKAAGARVEFVTGGAELLERKADPTDDDHDVILLDLEMPEIDGFETASRLRALGCALPIIALSAHAGGEHARRARVHGCDASLVKPFDPSDLASRILKAIESHGVRRPV